MVMRQLHEENGDTVQYFVFSGEYGMSGNIGKRVPDVFEYYKSY